jgi:hypothetical protein
LRLTEKIDGVRSSLTGEMGGLRSSVTEEIGGLRSDMNDGFTAVRSEMASIKVWALGLYIALGGTLLFVVAKGLKWL